MAEFPYTRGATNMIADGDYNAVIHAVSIYNNPNGADKLIVEFTLEDGTPFKSFFTPGFESFDQILVIAGIKLDKAEGKFDTEALKDKIVKFTTKITEATNGNEYCNVITIEELEKPKSKKDEEAPFEDEDAEKKSD